MLLSITFTFDTASLQSTYSSHLKIDTQQSLEILDKLYHEGSAKLSTNRLILY